MAQNLPVPGKPTAQRESTNKGKPGVNITWSFPTLPEIEVDSYMILYKVIGGEGDWKQKSIDVSQIKKSILFETVIPLKPNTYRFAIKVVFDDDNVSEMSEESDEFTLDANEESENIQVALKSSIKGDAKLVQKGDEKTNLPSVYQLNLKPIAMNQDKSIRKYEIGNNRYNDRVLEEKVILLVGATGSGKSTLVNMMVNYLFGFDLDDGALLRLTDETVTANQAESQTQSITAYTINCQPGMKVPGKIITIIDTPGFGNTRGLARDDEIVDQIRNFFTTQDQKLLVDHIDLVGFATQSSMPHFTPTQSYIFDKVLALFGKDIEEKIMMLLTFADNETPQVINGLEASGFKYKAYFKFNNSAIFTGRKTKSKEEAWAVGENSLKLFFEALLKCDPTSILLTKKVLEERQQLQLNMDQMHMNIQEGLSKLEQLRDGFNAIEKYEAEMKKHKDFTYETVVEDVKRIPVPEHTYTTYCVTCDRTCHNNCDYEEDSQKKKCEVMTLDGYCTVCPRRCFFQCHQHRPFEVVITKRKVRRTIEDLRQRYTEGKKGQLSTLELIKQIKQDFEKYQTKTFLLIDHNRQTVERLKEIALKPNPISTMDYIDTLIEAEMTDKKLGFLKRVQELRELKKKTEELVNVLKGGNDPFSSHRGILVALESTFDDI